MASWLSYQCNNSGTAAANSNPGMECLTPGLSKKTGKQYEKKMSGCTGSIMGVQLATRGKLKALSCFAYCQSVFLFMS